MARKKKIVSESSLRLDFGCGPHKREGFQGVDSRPFDGVDYVLDLTKTPWPWKNDSVDEAHASHFIEHLNAEQRIGFVNELYRVLKNGSSCQIIVPHWASCRAYGDLTHQWPPVSEFWFYYLSKEWRDQNAPHTNAAPEWDAPVGYNCNFEAAWGYSLRQDVQIRNQEYQQFAISNYKEVAQDIIATLTKRA